MDKTHRQRMARLQRLLEEKDLDSLLLTSPSDWYYLTGFTGEAGVLVVERRGATLVTDGRFRVQAREEARSLPVVLQKDGLYRTCGQLLRQRRRRRVGFDPARLTVSQWKVLKETAGRRTRFRQAGGLVEGLRAVK